MWSTSAARWPRARSRTAEPDRGAGTGVGAPGRADAAALDAVLGGRSAEGDRLWSVATGLLAASPRPHPRIALRIALECAGAVLRLAFQHDPEGDPALIAECRLLIRGYLA
ncbi:hypothetical protein [Streptacidiphilus cavernicola]|uniref:Tetracyclin repressor SCO1712-like C-terminal domain-containing protein n=1 Tax=Streptacidiphilus cavernicola TaxID=3342716 RepID=A0ABV6W4A8_9ACTN